MVSYIILKKKKSQGLPVNMLVMIIIGIILFGMSLMVFKKFANASEDKVKNLEGEIKNNLEELECENDKFVCAPTFNIRSGRMETFRIFISNVDDSKKKILLNIKNSQGEYTRGGEGELKLHDDSCGEISLFFPDFEDEIDSGKSAQIPILINAKLVKKVPCTFTTVAKVFDSSVNPIKEIGKSPIIINVRD